MKKLSLILLTACLSLISCSSNDDDNSQPRESAKVERMRNQLTALSLINSESCSNPADWDLVLTSTDGCSSNHESYIIYSKKINVKDFLAKVEAYKRAKQKYQSKWKIYSACPMTLPPTGVDCYEGKPILSYKHVIY